MFSNDFELKLSANLAVATLEAAVRRDGRDCHSAGFVPVSQKSVQTTEAGSESKQGDEQKKPVREREPCGDRNSN